jgi:hypothetical protein
MRAFYNVLSASFVRIISSGSKNHCLLLLVHLPYIWEYVIFVYSNQSLRSRDLTYFRVHDDMVSNKRLIA